MTQARNIESIFPLTPLQEGILFHALKSPLPALYMGQYSCELCGALDAERLQAVWKGLFERHAALRTFFVWERQPRPMQIVRKRISLPWTTMDWRDLDASQVETRWNRLRRDDRKTGFQLDRAPMSRLVLVRCAEHRHLFYFAYHHLLLDGWSLRLLLNQAQDLYSQTHGPGMSTVSVEGRYADYVDWLLAADWQSADAYWSELLADFHTPTPLPLPAAEAAPAEDVDAYQSRQVFLEVREVERLTACARANRLTLNTLFVAAWAVVMGRYADGDDVVFGTAVAGRPLSLPWTGSAVGLFINTLALRVGLPASQRVGDWLHTLHGRVLEMREYELSPLVRVQRASGVDAGTPLFESLLVFQSVAESPPREPAWEVHDEQYLEFGNYPLAILVRPGSAFSVTAVHDAHRFSGPAVSRLLDHLRNALIGLTCHLDDALEEIPVIGEAETDRLLRHWSGRRAPPRTVTTIGQSIAEDWAVRAPRPALLSEGGDLSYSELIARVAAISDRLRARGIGAGDFAAVYLERGVDAVAAMLAIQAVGGAYVPLDPSHPAQRSHAILEDLAAAARADGHRVALLSAEGRSERLSFSGAVVVQVDAGVGSDGLAGLAQSGSPDAIAYVMYTSGSTGRPKGVLVRHDNLVNSTLARTTYYGAPPDRFLLLSSLATDSSIAGLFWTLSSGGSLVLPKAHEERSVDAIAALIRSRGVTHVLCLPSLYGLLLENAPPGSLGSLTCVIVAGEACGEGLVERHFDRLPGVGLYNEYGPSEATVWATAAGLTPEMAVGPVPIGRPVEGARVYVLDGRGRVVPQGLPGELCIGGAGVAQGYLGQAGLTEEKFVTDPFSEPAGGRLYRSGDRVRFLEDGQLAFLGRLDNQIKVRGFRVEPEEIARVLQRHAGIVQAAVVLAGGDGPSASASGGMLVAYFTASPVPETSELRAFVGARLPEHMVPQLFVPLDALPLAAGGKIDVWALTARPIETPVADEAAYVAPRTDEQRTLAEIWCEVLNLDRVGIHDDFFELGGDSLLSIRILARAGRAGLTIPPTLFFDRPTIAAQVDAIAAQGGADAAEPAASKTVKPSAHEMLGDSGLAALSRQLGEAEDGDQR